MYRAFPRQNDDTFHFEMIYQITVPVEDSRDYDLSIGTITLSIPESISFDFTITEWSCYTGENGLVNIHALYYDQQNEVYADEYNELGLHPDQMNYGFFIERLDKLKVTEVFTECLHRETEIHVPITLTLLDLVFNKEDKNILITDKITAECQNQLKNILKENEIMNTNNQFNGKNVVITGKLINGTRDEIEAKLISMGANPGSSVSKNTDYLIVGEKAGSKLAKAQSLGVTILTEDEFEAILASS